MGNQIHRSEAESMDKSNSTEGGHDFFDAGVHEECEDDGTIQRPLQYHSTPEGS
jgi:hypothetical protein